MMPDSYKEIFTYVNKNYRDYLEFIEIDPIYRLFSNDGTTIDFNTDISSLTKTLEGISKEDSLGYFKFLSDVYEKYLIANEYFLQRSHDTPKESFNLKTIQEAFKVHTLSTSYDYISKYITDEKLRDFLAFQCMYIGMSPHLMVLISIRLYLLSPSYMGCGSLKVVCTHLLMPFQS